MFKSNIYIKPICLYDGFNLGQLIYDKLSEISDGWLYDETLGTGPGAPIYQWIVRKSEKNPNVGYGFRAMKVGSENPELSAVICVFSGDKVSTGYQAWSSGIYAWRDGLPYLDGKYIESDVTVIIGKQNRCYSISVTPHNAGYKMMNAVCGEDANGDVYAFYPGRRIQGGYDKTMLFRTFVNNDTATIIDGTMEVNYPEDISNPVDDGMGIIQNNQKLVLYPFINPVTGVTCADLYMPILGPLTTRMYELFIGNRKFITGSSCPPGDINNSISDVEYQTYYKVFMEV